MARAVRALLAVVFVAAQFATGSLAAQTAPQGAPCPVHLAIAPDQDRAHAHHGHGAVEHAHGHEQPGDEDGSEAPPHFSAACCATCAAGLIASDILLLMPDWHRRPALSVTDGLEPGELSSTDPPPRILL